MPIFILRRALESFATLFVLTLVIFLLARLVGDPAPLVLGTEATPADLAFYRHQYGLDRPLVMQYLTFLGNVAQGDFGASFRYRVPAIGLILPALWATFKLTGLAMLVSLCIGVPLGIVGSVRPRGWVSRAVTWYAAAGESIPSFWFGLLMMLVFAVNLGVLPSSGYGTWQHYVLPVTTLALFSSASLAALTRANMISALQSDFVKMQRNLGLREASIVFKHALRNASLPIITFLGLQFGVLLGGAVVTERVFSWPGVGQVMVEAIFTRDYPLIQAGVLVTAFCFMVINLLVDVLATTLDPRVRQ